MKKFIVFEGPDGSGKTSFMKLFSEHLGCLGFPHMTVREPGTGKVGEACRKLALSNVMTDRARAMLMYTSRCLMLDELRKYDGIVLCDRYTWSSYAYQSSVTNLRLLDTFIDIEVPDLIVYLHAPTEVRIGRIASRRNGFFDETEKQDQDQLAKIYDQLFATASDRSEVILKLDSSIPLDSMTRYLDTVASYAGIC